MTCFLDKPNSPHNTLPGVPLPGLPPIALPGLPPIPVPAVPAVPGRYGTNLSSPLATPPNPAPSINCVNVVIPLPLLPPPFPRPVSGVKAIGSAKTSILTSLTALALPTCPCGVLGGLGLVYAGGGTLRESSEPGGVRFRVSGAGTMSRREKSLRMTGCAPAGMMGWEMMLPKEEVEEGVRLRVVEVWGLVVGGGRLLRRMRRNATRMAARTATSAPMVMPAMMAAEGVLLLGVAVGSGEAAPLVVGRVGVGGGGGVVVGEGTVVEEEVGGGGGGMDWSLSRTQLSSPAQE